MGAMGAGGLIYVGSRLINMDHVLYVDPPKKSASGKRKMFQIHFDNGEVFSEDESYYETVENIGYDFILQVLPVYGCQAVFISDGHRYSVPVRYLALTAGGEIRPLSIIGGYVYFLDLSDGYMDLVWPDDPEISSTEDNPESAVLESSPGNS